MPLTKAAAIRRGKHDRKAVDANMQMADMGGWQVFQRLHDFLVLSASADGPRMTEMLVRFADGTEGLALRLWASNGQGTPVDRVAELRSALDAANARLRALGQPA